MSLRYFLVECKQGHHGKGRYQPIFFAIAAQNAIKAMDFAKMMPSVKHSQPILSCREISHSEYMRYRRISAYERREKNLWAMIQNKDSNERT